MTQEQTITLDNVVDLYRATIAHDAQWLADFDACGADDQLTIACEELEFDPDAAPAPAPAPTFTFITPQIDTPRAGDRTAQIEGYARTADGGFAYYEWEGAREDADAAARELLDAGLVTQVSIKMWVHDWNLPGALPAVRAHICGMDNATLDDSGALVRNTVNIW